MYVPSPVSCGGVSSLETVGPVLGMALWGVLGDRGERVKRGSSACRSPWHKAQGTGSGVVGAALTKSADRGQGADGGWRN